MIELFGFVLFQSLMVIAWLLFIFIGKFVLFIVEFQWIMKYACFCFCVILAMQMYFNFGLKRNG